MLKIHKIICKTNKQKKINKNITCFKTVNGNFIWKKYLNMSSIFIFHVTAMQQMYDVVVVVVVAAKLVVVVHSKPDRVSSFCHMFLLQ